MDKSTRKILFVVNPISGVSDKTQLMSGLENFIKKNSLVHRIFFTTDSDNLTHLKEEIKNFSPEVAVAVGGDGTCNLVASAIINTNITLAVLPFGSANGLATELGIPKTLNESLNLLISGKPKLIDTILINNKLCLHICDFGLNARVIKRFKEGEIRGIYGYARHFIKEIWGARPFKFSLILENGKEIRKKAHVVAIANASRYGTGVIINPQGRIDDGEFELVIVKPYSFFGFFSITAAIFMGYLDKIKSVETRSFKKVKIIKGNKQPLHIDGEIIENSSLVVAVINPASLRIIVPRGIN